MHLWVPGPGRDMFFKGSMLEKKKKLTRVTNFFHFIKKKQKKHLFHKKGPFRFWALGPKFHVGAMNLYIKQQNIKFLDDSKALFTLGNSQATQWKLD